MWWWWMKNEEENVVIAGVATPHHGYGLVLRDVFRTRDTSHLIIATELKENQTSYNAAATQTSLKDGMLLKNTLNLSKRYLLDQACY